MAGCFLCPGNQRQLLGATWTFNSVLGISTSLGCGILHVRRQSVSACLGTGALLCVVVPPP